MRLRWKKEPRETGLRAINARPRSSFLRDADGQRYACVSEIRGSWYWVAGWGSGIPHRNTCETPVTTEEKAKADAHAYVKSHLDALYRAREHVGG
jgi:hypothetical protein